MHCPSHELGGAPLISPSIAFITWGRLSAMVGELSVAENMVLEYLPEFTRGGQLNRQAIQSHLNKIGVSVTNPFNLVAFEAAYREGGDWLNALMAYLQNTRDEAVAFIHSHLPKINVIRPQGTYLLWLDCRKLNLNDEALKRFFIEEAKLGLSPGAMFGTGGEGFMRMNIGTTKANVMAALMRFKYALA